MSAVRFVTLVLGLILCCQGQVELFHREAKIISVTGMRCSNHTFQLSHNGTVQVSMTRTSVPIMQLGLYVRKISVDELVGSVMTISSTGTTTFDFSLGLNESGAVFNVGVCPDQADSFDYVISFQFFCDKFSYPSGSGVVCLSCPVNGIRDNMFTSMNSQLGACQCQKGFKKSISDGHLNCTTCPKGVLCLGNENTVMDGYWPYKLDNSTEISFLKCPIPRACVHFEKISENTSASYSDCSHGYGGALCNNCEQDFFRLGERCYHCGNIALSALLVFLWCVLLFVSTLIILPMGMLNTYIGSLTITLTFVQSMIILIHF